MNINHGILNVLKHDNKHDLIHFGNSDSPCTGPSVNVPIQRTAHLFSAIPANDTKESMFGHQNVSSPAAGTKPDNLAPEASMCANH